MSNSRCFLPPATDDDYRLCTSECMAHTQEGKTRCRILNVLEKIVPAPTRPIAPTPPHNQPR